MVFIKSLLNPSTPPPIPEIMGASKGLLEGLKKTCHHLSVTNTHFDTLSKDPDLQTIVPKQLFFKTIEKVEGK